MRPMQSQNSADDDEVIREKDLGVLIWTQYVGNDRFEPWCRLEDRNRAGRGWTKRMKEHKYFSPAL